MKQKYSLLALLIFLIPTVMCGGVAINPTDIKPGTVDETEFGYVDGVTSSIQDQLDAISSTNAIWGTLMGVITNQTDLWMQLTNRYTKGEIDAFPSSGINNVDIVNWNTAYGWGDHSTNSYLITGGIGAWTNLSMYFNDAGFLATGGIGASTNLSDYNNDPGFLTGELDPVYLASVAAGISSGDVVNWNLAYGWGDHSTNGYMTASPETNTTTKEFTQDGVLYEVVGVGDYKWYSKLATTDDGGSAGEYTSMRSIGIGFPFTSTYLAQGDGLRGLYSKYTGSDNTREVWIADGVNGAGRYKYEGSGNTRDVSFGTATHAINVTSGDTALKDTDVQNLSATSFTNTGVIAQTYTTNSMTHQFYTPSNRWAYVEVYGIAPNLITNVIFTSPVKP